MSTRLEQFETEVFYNVMLGIASPKITDASGSTPIVACLDDEPLSALFDRIRRVNGYATIYSLRYDGTVRVLACLPSTDSLHLDATDMTGEPPCDTSEVGLFIDYVESQHDGVLTPDILPHTWMRSYGASKLETVA